MLYIYMLHISAKLLLSTSELGKQLENYSSEKSVKTGAEVQLVKN